MCAGDFVQPCCRKKSVREWEKQEREGEKTKRVVSGKEKFSSILQGSAR